MSKHWNNRYCKYFISDNELCLPVLKQEQIGEILLRTQQIAETLEGDGPKPKVSFDLEHFQVVDYSMLQPVTLQQQETIRKLRATEPIRTDEMAYLALRSMIGLQWDKPQSEDDVRRAAAYDTALEIVLTENSVSIAQTLAQPEALLPLKWPPLSRQI